MVAKWNDSNNKTIKKYLFFKKKSFNNDTKLVCTFQLLLIHKTEKGQINYSTIEIFMQIHV